MNDMPSALTGIFIGVIGSCILIGISGVIVMVGSIFNVEVRGEWQESFWYNFLTGLLVLGIPLGTFALLGWLFIPGVPQ